MNDGWLVGRQWPCVQLLLLELLLVLLDWTKMLMFGILYPEQREED